jgi:hypothetical protein
MRKEAATAPNSGVHVPKRPLYNARPWHTFI